MSATLRLTPDQAGNVVKQLPDAAQRSGSGVKYASGVLTVPDQWAAAAQQADPNATPLLPPLIGAECDRRIAETGISARRGSMNSYLGTLNAKVLDGDALSTDETADRALLRSVDAWEGDMVVTRQALISAADPTFANDAHWPPKPAGLTLEWLAGF